jgi:hypothetical protein
MLSLCQNSSKNPRKIFLLVSYFGFCNLFILWCAHLAVPSSFNAHLLHHIACQLPYGTTEGQPLKKDVFIEENPWSVYSAIFRASPPNNAFFRKASTVDT